MTTAYTATIRHHSISRARTVSAATLPAAKHLATKEFGGGFLDHEIVIYCGDEIASRRRIGERGWHDAR